MTDDKSQPRKRNRGKHYPELSEALRNYLQPKVDDRVLTKSKVKSKRQDTLYSMHSSIVKNPKRYGVVGRFSIDAIRNVLGDKNIMEKTLNVVRKYLELNANYIVPVEKLADTKLDISTFFGMKEDNVKALRYILEGTYQSYARATSIPSEGDMVRRGRIDIWFDPMYFQFRIEEEQHRPEIALYPEISLTWNGFCVLREDKLFCVMRTQEALGRTTPLFCIFNAYKSNSGGKERIERLIGLSMGFDPENASWPSVPKIYAERTTKEAIFVDFCPTSEVKDHINREIFIGYERT